MAPHITFWIVARGINIGLHTRLYFGDEQAANETDPLLSRVELESTGGDADRRSWRGEWRALL